jgi:hypothetical protein
VAGRVYARPSQAIGMLARPGPWPRVRRNPQAVAKHPASKIGVARGASTLRRRISSPKIFSVSEHFGGEMAWREYNRRDLKVTPRINDPFACSKDA